MSTPIQPLTNALTLFQRWKAGDQEALDQLIREIQPWLQSELSRRLGTTPRPAEASFDMAQDAVVKFLKCGPSYEFTTESKFAACLRKIAINSVIDASRKRSSRGQERHVESMLPAGGSFSGFGPAQRSAESPSRISERSEEAEWVRLALQFLEPDERYLLIASEVEGQSWETIAEDLGMASADAARVRGARLKPKVARLLMQLRRGQMPEEN